MSGHEIRPLIGTSFTKSPEDPVMTNIIENFIQDTDGCAQSPAAESPKAVISMADPDSITEHPISQAAALELCEQLVGIGRRSRCSRWVDPLPVWWERLRTASTAEEKLTCERMINALNRAAGMHDMDRAARVAARNMARIDREEAEEAAAEKAAEEAAAIDRWR